jgi:hypothetical protein
MKLILPCQKMRQAWIKSKECENKESENLWIKKLPICLKLQ